MKNFHRNLVERFDHLYYAALVFFSVKVLDVVSTSILAKRYGTAGEQTRLTRYAMDHLGIDAGLIVKNIPVLIIVFGVGYFLNRANRDKEKRLQRNLGAVFVYAISVPGVIIMINNFVQVFE